MMVSLAAFAEEPENVVDSLTDETGVDTTLYTRRNVAVGFNSLDYLLEKRYMKYGDEFTKLWDDHLFIEAGLGAEHVVAPTDDYKFTPITTVKFAVGKQFNKRNTMRLTLYGGYAYQHEKDFFMMKLGGKLDHIFDMSSYFSGYDPTRRLSLSTVVGVGVTNSRYLNNGGFEHLNGTAAECHAGLQLKFFTGPQGYINIEPYVGLATDPMDVSEQRNWRKYDGFYGANLTYVYYIHNNLSPEARNRYLTNRKLKDDITPDSTLYSWRKPAFIELSNALHFRGSGVSRFTDVMGAGYAVSIGKWFSPAIALRATVAAENTTFMRVPSIVVYDGYKIGEPKENTFTNYATLRMEALFNPLGLVRHYNWDSKYGAYLVLGLQAGKVWKGPDGEKPATQGYTAGVHLWTRLAEGLHLFVEPRFDHKIYHLTNVDDLPQNKRYSDNLTSINIGLTVNTRTRKFTDWGIYEELDEVQFMNKLVAGVGGGLNYLQNHQQYGSNVKPGFNGQVFAEWHLNDVHAARLSAEFTMHPLIDINGKQLWKFDNINCPVSLDYMLCLTNLLNRTNPDGRRFDAYLFAGPTMFMTRNNETGSFDSPRFSANGGAKLLFKLNRRIGFHLTPTFYFVTKQMRDEDVFGGSFLCNFTLFETLNAGVQYSF